MVKAFEIVAIIFFGIATMFYNLGHTTSFIVSTIIGCVMSLFALITHHKEATTPKDESPNIQITLSKDILVSSYGEETSTMGATITNLSSFAVTVSEIGFKIKDSPLRVIIPIPLSQDNEPLPRRIEPRSKFKFHMKPDVILDPAFETYTEFYASTDCGQTYSKGLGNIMEMLK